MAGFEQALAGLASGFAPDLASVPGAGAAGGLGFGLMAFCGATIVSGFGIVAELLGLEEAVAAADLVVTGEGSLDDQTMDGKGPHGVAALARRHGKPVVGVGGRVTEAARPAFSLLLAASPPDLPVEQAMSRASEFIEAAMRRAAPSCARWCRPECAAVDPGALVFPGSSGGCAAWSSLLRLRDESIRSYFFFRARERRKWAWAATWSPPSRRPPRCLRKRRKSLGFDLTGVMAHGPVGNADAARATASRHCTCTAWPLLAVLREQLPDLRIAACAGLSLGEFTAHAAAGTFSFADGLRLVAARGRFMDEACEAAAGAMVAMIGGEESAVRSLAAECDVDVANLNAPGQIVLSGIDRGHRPSRRGSQSPGHASGQTASGRRCLPQPADAAGPGKARRELARRRRGRAIRPGHFQRHGRSGARCGARSAAPSRPKSPDQSDGANRCSVSAPTVTSNFSNSVPAGCSPA